MDCVLVEGKQDSAGAHIIDLPEPVSCVGYNGAVFNYILVFGKHVGGRGTVVLWFLLRKIVELACNLVVSSKKG